WHSSLVAQLRLRSSGKLAICILQFAFCNFPPPNLGVPSMSSAILTRHYGSAAGPLGFPMLDRQAFALEAILKALPKDDSFAYRKTLIAEKASEVLPGERSDVSWISTEDPDRTNEVVVARGMNDSQFRLNPI